MRHLTSLHDSDTIATTEPNTMSKKAIVKPEANAKAEVKEKSFADFSEATIKEAMAMLKAKGITKAAKRPSGEYLYLRPRNIDDTLKDAIQKFMTENKNASVHDMAEYALCKLLGVTVRDSVKQVIAK